MTTDTMWVLGSMLFFVPTMVFIIILPLKPEVVLITQRFVCPPDRKMEVQTMRHTYHRPGERAIVVTCCGSGEPKIVNRKALWILWLIFFVLSLPVSIGSGLLISSLFPA